MVWFTPTAAELSAIEQIEAALCDESLSRQDREYLVRKYWAKFENAHGSVVLSIVSPEGVITLRPFDDD